jgi:hypothetical protein
MGAPAWTNPTLAFAIRAVCSGRSSSTASERGHPPAPAARGAKLSFAVDRERRARFSRKRSPDPACADECVRGIAITHQTWSASSLGRQSDRELESAAEAKAIIGSHERPHLKWSSPGSAGLAGGSRLER